MKALSIIGLASVAMLGITTSSTAQEQGRVISSTPVIQQVAVPRQVCSNEQVTTQSARKSGAGALMGGIAGGAMGNAIGDGSGRAAATMLGVIGGVILGDKIEGGQQQTNTQNVQRCTTQTFYENKPVAYNVVYEFNGKQYQVQLAQDPGPFVGLQVTPVGGAPAAPVQPAPVIVQPVSQAPVWTQPTYAESSAVYVQHPPVIYVRPAPVVVYGHGYTYARPHPHSHLHPHLQPQHLAYPHGWRGHPYGPRHRGNTVSIGFSGHIR